MNNLKFELVDGTSKGPIIIKTYGWSGKIVKISRMDIKKFDRDKLSQPGVYFLFYKNDNNEDCVYIGESLDVRERLIGHINANKLGTEKYYWNTAVVLMAQDDFNEDAIKFLEDEFVELAREKKTFRVKTEKTTKKYKLDESEKYVLENSFIKNTNIVLETLGYNLLSLNEDETKTTDSNDEIFTIIGKYANAKGKFDNEKGFTLIKGSTIDHRVADSLLKGHKVVREALLGDTRIVKNYKTMRDISFPSPSAAAIFVLGCMASGPQKWKINGITLKEYQKSKD